LAILSVQQYCTHVESVDNSPQIWGRAYASDRDHLHSAEEFGDRLRYSCAIANEKELDNPAEDSNLSYIRIEKAVKKREHAFPLAVDNNGRFRVSDCPARARVISIMEQKRRKDPRALSRWKLLKDHVDWPENVQRSDLRSVIDFRDIAEHEQVVGGFSNILKDLNEYLRRSMRAFC